MPEYLKSMPTPLLLQTLRRWNRALVWYENDVAPWKFAQDQLRRAIPLAAALAWARTFRGYCRAV